MNQHTLTFFSGIGGFSLAFEAEGFKTIGFAEIDPYASAVLKRHWPDVPNYGDVRNVGRINCDIITGGFPCQPFSVAGKRKGKTDDRYLWPAMLAVIDRCRPAYVLGENVPGIVSMELDYMLSDLEGIGYTARPFIIPACAINADQERCRVWIAAHTNRKWKLQSEGRIKNKRRRLGNCIENVANTYRTRCARRLPSRTNSEDAGNVVTGNGSGNYIASGLSKQYWDHKPILGGRVHGVSNRVDRIRCLGNSIVPQIAQVFAKAIRSALETEFPQALQLE